ncbi:Protein kinase-like (PK-like) [Glarea lozoyensis ATCC 20868]|uniref:non-specific serine/threonine protein kinase n=1 Tax=Glarea lozoyensis (strain ATCC 20868 / MF5171) TaxID=1116229 RepID=S3DGH7_GLAL2|nr:Protein kinase-like (PK-like) [Glarea lozoyensis ATCC 20868]EPE25708.1 Protein kinase-like (PK-like) [Glarea lozoyensis ATCC 20868]
MSNQLPPRPPSRRQPLGEATRRVNNAQQPQSMPHHESLKVDGLLQVHKPSSPSPLSQGETYRDASRGSPANPRLSAISKDYQGTDSNRNSQISTVSTNASDGKRIKQCIGPWKLGKTLGKGATARVRLARHAYTGQEAAIKIVQKKNAIMSQAGSLADIADTTASDFDESFRRMPVGIEREVTIMKLIQHPNILKLYDIWENRTEIYLVLEYVDNGELFEHISTKGRLSEAEAVRYFRQILSAVGYCHSMNICHRDLKPENILLTRGGDIKIADFGMAALHQSPDHKLKTSCGSPHYAAPELIRGSNYRGDKVDIWSMGVILYATLAGRLPFDVDGNSKDWLQPLLQKIRKGQYEMAPEFSKDTVSLIWRMLQVDPRNRINLNQIWRHPLVRKYEYLDDLGKGNQSMSPSAMDCARPVMRRSEINKELLHHMRSLWHKYTEQQLLDALLSEEPNEQKLFYTLLLKHRETQLENYIPDLASSASDYHHARPLAMTKTYSTCNFSQVNTKGRGRQVSRFTVISNAAETEKSYDPFKASRPQHLDAMREAEGVKVVIHRDQDSGEDEASLKMRIPSKNSVSNAKDRGRQRPVHPRMYASRSSMASSSRSRGSAVYSRAVIVGRKRGVSFTHLRRLSGESRVNLSSSPHNFKAGRHSNHTEVTDDGGDIIRPVNAISASAQYIRSKKGQIVAVKPLLAAPKNGRGSQIWTEDVRQLSTSLAKDCDEAFNRTSIVPGSKGRKLKRASLDSRPLPPPPARSDSVKMELMEYRKQAELRKHYGGGGSPGHLDRMVSHFDTLIQQTSPTKVGSTRRAISTPVEAKHRAPARPLPSIHEARGEDTSPRKSSHTRKEYGKPRVEAAKSSRIASAPEPRTATTQYSEDYFSKQASQIKDTIRVVPPSSPMSPVKVPAPLSIRKKSSKGGGAVPMMSGGLDYNSAGKNNHRTSTLELRQQYIAGGEQGRSELETIDEHQYNTQSENVGHDTSLGTIVRKKSSWFKRNSRSGSIELKNSEAASDSLLSEASSKNTADDFHNPRPLPVPAKNKGFSLRRLFKKRNSKPDMTVSPYDIYDDNTDTQVSMADVQQQAHAARSAHHDDPRARQIEPQQNWFAKLFNVKPATKYICFSVSRRRARQEITSVLREWRRYGIRDVQVDKERNIVFGKVGAKNFLDMKEVAFAAEVMTVIEHGKRSALSIARFTQERGAASSFQKVVETMESVLKCRGDVGIFGWRPQDFYYFVQPF